MSDSSGSDSSGSDSPGRVSALLDRFDDLYALARVLGGEAGAEDLVREAFRRAAETDPSDRPDPSSTESMRGWLVGLLLEARRERTDETADRGPGDPFGQEAARQAAERTLPIAFAACSAQERAVLTLDVLSEATDAEIAAAFEMTMPEAREQRDEARASLRAALRDSLTGPERMLVDVALSESELRDALRNVLRHRFHPGPSDLYSTVASQVRQAEARRTASAADADGASAAESTPDGEDDRDESHSEESALEPDSFALTGGVVGVFVLLLLFLGGYVLNAVTSPPEESAAPTPVLETFAARQSAAVTTVLADADSAQAIAYVEETYNRQISVPRIDDASVHAVAELSATGSRSVPVLLYRSPQEPDEEIVVYAFSYALLDTLSDRVTLRSGLRNQLEQPRTIIARRVGDRSVLLWRTRDDIYVLVAADAEPDSLAARIQP